MKIIYIFELRHCYTYDKSLFQFDCFAENEIEVWSLVNWYFPKIATPLNLCTEKFVHYINNEQGFLANLERIKNENCYFLVYPYGLSYDKNSFFIRNQIRKSGFRFSNIIMSEGLASLPDFSTRISYLRIFKRIIKDVVYPFFILMQYLMRKEEKHLLKNKLSKKLIQEFGPAIAKSDYNFLPTSVCYYNFPSIFEIFSKRNVIIHSDTYDEVLLTNDEVNSFGKFIVFVDQYLAGHSDFKKNGMKNPVSDSTIYYRQLSELFKKLENLFSCEVIVAAHPKAEYKGDEFEGRKIIYNSTNKLIRNSELVIIHNSTCFGLITLLGKPFLNIYANEFFINTPTMEISFNNIKKFFNCKQLDFYNPHEIENVKEYIYINPRIYSLYNEKYVYEKNSIGQDKLFYEIVSDYIQKGV